jgi:hypothetical protein
MIAYAASDNLDGYVKCTLPEVFLDAIQNGGNAYESKLVQQPNSSMFVNKYKPALRNEIIVRNYINIPLSSTARTSFFSVGDKLLVAFVNNNPLNGLIIGRY